MNTAIDNQKITSTDRAESIGIAQYTSATGDGVCPLRDILDRIGDKWTVLVIIMLGDGRLRFSDLLRSIEGISQRMLTQTLRQLERDGLINRFVYPSVPMRVEYELTTIGKTLIEPLTALARWSERHQNAILASRAVYDARDDNA